MTSLVGQLAWVTACHVHRERIAEMVRTATDDDRFAWGFFGYGFPEFYEAQATVLRPFTDLLRDVVGNPFRPAAIPTRCLTPSILALAAEIDEDGSFDRLPDLADALEAAGCDDAKVLRHCRGQEGHVRRCWAVDLLLGRA